MTSRTHDVFAFASLMTAAVYSPPASLNLSTAVTSSIGCIVGSLLPDIDQASNRLWDLLPGGNLIGKIFKRFFLAHRTISHSILGAFLVYKATFWLLPKILNQNYLDIKIIFASIMVGYISHLVLDCFTEEGLPLLFPLKYKFGFPPIRSWRIKTGKGFEKFVVFPGIIAYIIFFTGKNQGKILEIFRLIIG